MRSLEEILPLLIERTEDGELSWNTDGHGFDARLGKHFLYVWKWSDPNDETAGISLQLKDHQEKVLDDIVAGEYAPNFSPLNRLFGAARRNALNVDEVINSLEAALRR